MPPAVTEEDVAPVDGEPVLHGYFKSIWACVPVFGEHFGRIRYATHDYVIAGLHGPEGDLFGRRWPRHAHQGRAGERVEGRGGGVRWGGGADKPKKGLANKQIVTSNQKKKVVSQLVWIF